jgi:DNA-binding MarR family transcriptional regulator
MPQTQHSDLADLLLALVRQIHEQVKKRGEKQTLTAVQMHALLAIQFKTSPTIGDISKCLAVTPPSATVLVQELLKQKLIDRTSDPADRRTTHLALTEHGKSVLDARMRLVSEGIEKMASCLTPDEHQNLTTLLTKMTTTQHK